MRNRFSLFFMYFFLSGIIFLITVFSRQVSATENSRIFYMNQGTLLQPSLLVGFAFQPGDLIKDAEKEFGILSDNVEQVEEEIILISCILKKIQKPLPKSRNGVYWANFGNDELNILGYTVDWYSVLGYRQSYTMINRTYKQNLVQGCSQNPQVFIDFAVTLYHEVKGHNIDRASHNTDSTYDKFVQLYEKPIYDYFHNNDICELVDACS